MATKWASAIVGRWEAADMSEESKRRAREIVTLLAIIFLVAWALSMATLRAMDALDRQAKSILETHEGVQWWK